MGNDHGQRSPSTEDQVDSLIGRVSYSYYDKSSYNEENSYHCYASRVNEFFLTRQLKDRINVDDQLFSPYYTTDHVILNHGQVTWTTPELAPPLLTTTPHQRKDVSAVDRFNVHRCATRRVFSGTGLELMTYLPWSDTLTTGLPQPSFNTEEPHQRHWVHHDTLKKSSPYPVKVSPPRYNCTNTNNQKSNKPQSKLGMEKGDEEEGKLEHESLHTRTNEIIVRAADEGKRSHERYGHSN
ncbi:uncharacterized protein TNCV_2499761 [Trichonephila clavipes]|nr:uncharacterized protein TNCV_2499761 [Trichonephila clavipes]